MKAIRDISRKHRAALTHLPDLAGVSRSHFWDVLAGRKSPTLQWLSRIAQALEIGLPELFAMGTESTPGTSAIPLYALQAAAGSIGVAREVEPLGWLQLKVAPRNAAQMFVTQVTGHSMEPLIADGALCLFKRIAAAEAEGRVVLVQHRDIRDVETGGSYTVKRFKTVKARRGAQEPEVHLLSVNKRFSPIVLKPDVWSDVRVVGEFVSVLPLGRGE